MSSRPGGAAHIVNPCQERQGKAKRSEMMLSLVVSTIILVFRKLAWGELECADKLGCTARSCIENKEEERECWVGR